MKTASVADLMANKIGIRNLGVTSLANYHDVTAALAPAELGVKQFNAGSEDRFRTGELKNRDALNSITRQNNIDTNLTHLKTTKLIADERLAGVTARMESAATIAEAKNEVARAKQALDEATKTPKETELAKKTADADIALATPAATLAGTDIGTALAAQKLGLKPVAPVNRSILNPMRIFSNNRAGGFQDAAGNYVAPSAVGGFRGATTSANPDAAALAAGYTPAQISAYKQSKGLQ